MEDLRRMPNAQLNLRQAQENPSLGVLPAEGGVKASHKPSAGSRSYSWPGNTLGVSCSWLSLRSGLIHLLMFAHKRVQVVPTHGLLQPPNWNLELRRE